MKYLRLLFFFALSFALQTLQAAIPENERNALLSILQFTDNPSQIIESIPIGSECSWSRVACNKSQENIISLDLFNIGLNNLSPVIEHLTALEHLDLSFNQLTSLPVEIWKLTTLEYLNIEHNQLASLAQEINQLTSLKYLNLGFNHLKGLPAEIWQLTALEELNLEIIQLKTLPPQIEQLPNLNYLHLNSTGLSSLPSEIGQLTALKELHLSYNLLTFLPPEIGQLTDLYALYLSFNQLTSLPPELVQLTLLHHLDLQGNLLSTLPDTFAQITGGFLCDINGCREAIYMSLKGNCFSNSRLSPEIIEWLNSSLVSTLSSSPLEEQKDICTNEFASLSMYAEVHFRNSHIIDFINTDSAPIHTEQKGSIAYSIYQRDFTGRLSIHEINSFNKSSSALASGVVDQVNSSTWRIDTQNIAVNNNYAIIFWIEDNTNATGVKAWARPFLNITDEAMIPFDTDLTTYFVVNNDEYSPEPNPILNLEYSFFADDLSPFEQLKKIPGLEALQYNNGLLAVSDLDKQYNLRPFKIEKSSANSQVGYQLTTDGVVTFTTSNLRTITAAPAIENLDAFKTSLNNIGLTLQGIGSEGIMIMTPIDSAGTSSVFSAIPDFVSQPATVTISGPGIYLGTAKDFPMMPMAYHVYYDAQGKLLQQAIPPEPYDGSSLLNELELLGFSNVAKSQPGIISVKKGPIIYRAYMAYDAHLFDIAQEGISSFQALGDLNGDGYQDFLFKSKYAEQILYLLPTLIVE